MKIEIGKTYKVEIDDCCVNGRFTSKLTKVQISGDNDVLQSTDQMQWGVKLNFENGVELTNEGGVALEEIDIG